MFVNEFGDTFKIEVMRRKLNEDCDILDDITQQPIVFAVDERGI
jgi:hypothetical protein